MKKLLYVSFALLILLGLSGVSGAMKGMGMDGTCMGKGMKMVMDMEMSDEMPMMGRMMMSLDLNDNQKEDMKTIHLKLKKEVIKKKADIEISEIELKEILMKDPVDVKTAEDKIKQIESLQAEVKILHLRAREDAKKKLTPEQIKKLNSHMQMHQMKEGKCMKEGCGMHCMDQMNDENSGDSKGPLSPEPKQHQRHH
jgi:Spy/CpxP family protein refolding chaperone